MKKNLLILLIALKTYASCPDECIDPQLPSQLAMQSYSQFLQLDLETAQKINEVIKKINEAHQKIEKETQEIWVDIEALTELRALIDKELLFNQKIINEIQNLNNSKRATENIANKRELK